MSTLLAETRETNISSV
jgi:hypothetical protein